VKMANIDISIIFIVVVISLLITMIGYMTKEWLLYLFSVIYGIMAVAYLNANYSLVSFGSQTISFYPIFTLAFFFLSMLLPLIFLYRRFFQ